MQDVLKKISKTYLLLLASFGIFRLLLCLNEFALVKSIEHPSELFWAFVMGLRFDLVIAGYILILPYLILGIALLFRRHYTRFNKFVFYYILALSSIALLIHAADIPYFHQFFNRFNSTAFAWFDHPAFVWNMIVQEPQYIVVALPFILINIVFYKFLKSTYLKNTIYNINSIKTPLWHTLPYLLCAALILLGIRGRIAQKSPIRIGTAYFSENAFVNQLGLNPVYTLMRSSLDALNAHNNPQAFMDSKHALALVREYLNLNKNISSNNLKRSLTNNLNSNLNFENVVIILMESMSAAKTKHGGNPHNLTPFLDSLSEQSIYFNRAYSAGTHTFNGIYSTLFGYPALMRMHPMKNFPSPKHQGIFSTLKQQGYTTAFFTTHDAQFDNVEGFLKSNGCTHVISQKDYPSSAVKSTLGVPDDVFFKLAIPRLNQFYNLNKPFIAAFMTASDHGPYIVPSYFKPKASDIKYQIVQYADYSLKNFMQMASQQAWYSKTLFVFVADHGVAMDPTYSMPLSYHHIPLLFFNPTLPPQNISNMASQIDVFPSIMGLLNRPYTNYSMGINLFKEQRPYAYFSADDKYGVIDSSHYLVVNQAQETFLYHYPQKDKTNYAGQHPQKTQAMHTYVKAHLQVYQDLWKTNRFCD